MPDDDTVRSTTTVCGCTVLRATTRATTSGDVRFISANTSGSFVIATPT